MVHVYTGNGKGKTTAALGLAMRAAGHGLKVEIIQFMKEARVYGEYKAIEKLGFEGRAGITIVQFGTGMFVDKGSVSEDDKKRAGEGMAHAGRVLNGGKADVLILDEVNVAMDYGILEKEEIKKFIEKYRSDSELVLTGRGCPVELVRLADYVTEMKEVKHPFNEGVKGREGIEF